MKKTKKLFLSLALIFGFSLSMPTLASITNIAKADPIMADYYLQVEKFDNSAKVGSTYTLPNAVVFNITTNTAEAVGADIKVINPRGSEVDVEDNSFFVTHFGTYSIEYTYFGQTQKFSVFATENNYSFNFAENSEKIIPSIMNKSIDKDIVLPNPTIVNQDGEEITLPQASLVITVQNPALESVALNNVEGGFKSFKPDADGVWLVNYKYVLDSQNSNKVLVSEDKRINVTSTYNNQYDLVLSHSTPPASADTKTEVNLPTITVKNASTNNLLENQSYYLEIKAEKLVYNQSGSLIGREDVTQESINGKVFTPQTDGDYVITYTVSDFFGNTVTKEIALIEDVKDKKAPEVKIVAPYDTAPESLVDYSHNIPSKAKSDHLVLPAIWAEDNVDKTLEGLTLTRKIRRLGGTVVYESSDNPNKEIVFNPQAQLGANQVEAQLTGENNWTKGTYVISYIAKDSAGNTQTSTEFRLEIDNDFQENVSPEINWSTEQNFPTRVKLGQTLKFASPVVKREPQERVLTQVEYAFADASTPSENLNQEDWMLIDTADKAIYEIEIPETVVAGVKTVRVRAKAYAYKSESDYIYKTVNILEMQDAAPVEIVGIVTYLGNDFRQGRNITLDSFVFEDDIVGSLAYEFKAVAQNGQFIPVVNSQRVISGNQATISDAKFFASFPGDYTITIKATDLGGNIAVYTYTINVAAYQDQIEPHFSAPKTISDGVVQLGDVVSIPEAVIVSGQENQPEYMVNVISGPSSYRIDNFEFEAFEEGVYTIQYSATVEGQEITATFQVEVADTKAPEIAGWEDIKAEHFPSRVDINHELIIPVVGFEYDNSGIDMKNSKVEVRRGNITITTITLEDLTQDNPSAKLTLSSNAEYTIIYTVKDLAKTPNTKTFEAKISVGDTTNPEVTVKQEHKDTFVPEQVKIGTVVDLDLSKLIVVDEGVELDKQDLEISLTLDGNKIENRFGEDEKTRYGYKLTQAGEYTLTITIKDAAGNQSEPLRRTIVVTAEDNQGIETTEVIGLVLIVVSALILAGAIVYFIISKRVANEYKAKR